MLFNFVDIAGSVLGTRLECSDTPEWDDNFKSYCRSYAREGWCVGGSIIPPNQGGPKFNYPERNCCICGKGGEQNI